MEAELAALRAEVRRLRAENARLEAVLRLTPADLTPALASTLMHAASMRNPEFDERQRQRRSTLGVPRFLRSFDETLAGDLVPGTSPPGSPGGSASSQQPAASSRQPVPPGHAAAGAPDGAAPARDGFARLLADIGFGLMPAALTHTDRELARAYHVFQTLMRAWEEWERQRAPRTLTQPLAQPVRTDSQPVSRRTQARPGHLHH